MPLVTEFRNPIVEVNFRKELIAVKTYFLAIDISNASGRYKHDTTSGGIKIMGVNNLLIKTSAVDMWSCRSGIVLDINGTNATIGWLIPGTIVARDSGSIQVDNIIFPYPMILDATVEANDFKKILTNFKETTTDLNTSTTIEDANGDMVVPAVGDLILRPAIFSPALGTLLMHYHIWYYVE